MFSPLLVHLLFYRVECGRRTHIGRKLFGGIFLIFFAEMRRKRCPKQGLRLTHYRFVLRVVPDACMHDPL